MPKVLAYQCPHTKLLFALEDKKKYDAHLRRLRKERYLQRKEDQIRHDFNSWFEESIANIDSVSKLEEWLLNGAIQRTLDYTTSKHEWNRTEYKKFKITNVSVSLVRFSDSESNSHCSPRGEVTNFLRKKELPTGFPGFSGNIFVKHEGDYPSFVLSGALTKLGICTGSGGNNRWTITLFLKDWPGLEQRISLLDRELNEINVINRLKGTATVNRSKYIMANL